MKWYGIAYAIPRETTVSHVNFHIMKIYTIPHYIISHWHRFFNSSCLNNQRILNKILERFPFDELLCANKQNKRTVWLSKQLIDLVNTDIAVLRSLFDS